MSAQVLKRSDQDGLELETVACDLCGGTRWHERYRMADINTELTPFEFPVVRCESCGLVWVNPRPAPASMPRFYVQGYHAGRDQPEHRARYARQLELVGTLSTESLLDIGCARGDWLAHVLQRHPGVKAVGLDAYSGGVTDERIEFHAGVLADAGLASARFDVATAWAVFEHLHAPLDYFREVARVLKPGGRFLFVVTNAESLWSKRAYREDVPRHTYHFSHATLREYARVSGFEVARLRCVGGLFDGRGKGTFKWGLPHAHGLSWQARRERRFSPGQLALKTFGQALDQLAFALPWELWLDRSGLLFAELRKP